MDKIVISNFTELNFRVIIFLNFVIEEVKQIFEFMIEITSEGPRLLILLNRSLYHLSDVFVTSCLLELFN